jgi:hypothetical protein
VSLELDHVLVAVTDLDAAAHSVEDRNGLASVAGGRHPGWGTANRIVPLGETYVELIAVVDEAEAARSRFGSWVAAAATADGALLGWAVRTADLDEVAGRLGLVVDAKSRRDAGGRLLRWRVAGVPEAAAEPPLPFILEWGEGTPFPGRAAVAHPRGPARLARVEVAGAAERLEHWLGGSRLPVTVCAGAPGVTAVVLTGQNCEFELQL